MNFKWDPYSPSFSSLLSSLPSQLTLLNFIVPFNRKKQRERKILSLAQIPPCLLQNVWNRLKQEIISFLIPIFLGNHPNSAVILQHAWNQSFNPHIIRTLIMNSMADWYTKAQDAEQNIRLARILDVSQDLKALSTLLNGQPLIFNIDLACLAARRGYLKLDKWMSDRIRDHGVSCLNTYLGDTNSNDIRK